MLLQLVLRYKYALLVPLAFIEGPTIMMLSGLLVRLGEMSFFLAYACLMFGDLLGDVMWYGIGYYGGTRFVRRFGKYFSITEDKIKKIDTIFHRHKKNILFISKITGGFGLSLATLVAAGMVEIPLLDFIFFNFLGELVWAGMLMAIGYFFGNAYLQIASIGGKIFFILLCGIIIVAILGFSKYIRKETSERL